MRPLLEEGLKEGLLEGIEKGIEKGQQNEKIQTASKMKRDGMSIALIAKYTGLSKQEIIDL